MSKVCMYFNNGGCWKNDECKYLHVSQHCNTSVTKHDENNINILCLPSVFGKCTDVNCKHIHASEDVRFKRRISIKKKDPTPYKHKKENELYIDELKYQLSKLQRKLDKSEYVNNKNIEHMKCIRSMLSCDLENKNMVGCKRKYSAGTTEHGAPSKQTKRRYFE